MGEPVFDRTKKYINKKGQKFGNGVWMDGDDIVFPGRGYFDRKSRTVTQYNTDGTKSVFSWEQWHHKKTLEHETRVLQNDRKWAIPQIPEKQMTLSIDSDSPTDRNRGATFTENVLDSIAVNAKRADIPFSTGLALASTESTIGSDEGRTAGVSLLPWLDVLCTDNSQYGQNAQKFHFSYANYYSPSALISNWKTGANYPFAAYEYNSQGELLETPRNEEYYNKDFASAVRKANNYNFEDKSPLQTGFELYKANPKKYNPNDPDYPNKVEANRKELVYHSPEIKAYMQKNNLHSEGGQLKHKQWEDLTMTEKADMMKAAVSEGIYDLPTIKAKYNEFAKGSDTKEGKYLATMEKVAEENYRKWGFSTPDEALTHALNDNTYDYRGYYDKYPQSDANADTHWTDEFKTVWHPTFSDESVYSGKVSQFNPQGLVGGHWAGDAFIPQDWQTLRQMQDNHYGIGGHIYDGTSENTQQMNTGQPRRERAQPRRATVKKDWDKKSAEFEEHTKRADEYWEKEQEELANRTPEQIRQMGIEADEQWKREHPNGSEANPELQKAANVVMGAMEQAVTGVPFTGDQVRETVERQEQERLNKWHDIRKGIDATMTAAEFLAAGYGLTRGLTHLSRYMAKQATQSVGQPVSREAMKNLLKWNNRVTTIDKPQVLMNTVGGTADAYQWATADNSFDAWENGLETGADAAGIVGGMNWFRDLPYLRRLGGEKIDAVLDGIGYGAAAWDVVKNLPPLSGAVNNIREQSQNKKSYGGLFDAVRDVEAKQNYKEESKDNAFTPIIKPVIPKVAGDQEAVNWLANWYNHRRKQLYDNINSSEKARTFMYDTKDFLTGTPIGRRAVNHAYYDKLNNMAQYKTATFEDLERDNTASYDDLIDKAFGIIVPETNKIYYNEAALQNATTIQNRQEGYSPQGVHIHERTHASGITGEDGKFTGYNAQTDALEKILKIKPGVEPDEYLDASPEIYGRMMEFRYNHRMNPHKTYTTEEIQKMLDQENKSYKSELQRYDIDSLTKAFNEVAFVNTPEEVDMFKTLYT